MENNIKTEKEYRLDPECVSKIFNECLFKDGENTDNHIKAEGVKTAIGFHPDRIEKNKEEIKLMLNELPDGFKKSKGGGWSFLQACDDRHGNQWTGMHQTMEQLFQLGIAVRLVKSMFPKGRWAMFPGGMPYYVVNDV